MAKYPITADIARCLSRLEDSAGRRAARRNARRQMGALIGVLRRMVEHDFPPLDKNGKEIVRKRKPCRCPVCKKYFPSWVLLATHLSGKHGWRNPRGIDGAKCPCGFSTMSMRRFAAHLAGQADLDFHATLNGLGRKDDVHFRMIKQDVPQGRSWMKKLLAELDNV